MHLKSDKNATIPNTPIAFYIKLYCERRGPSKSKFTNNLVEATKSWLSLTDTERQHFNQKYSEWRTTYRTKFIKSLKNAEPYMKKKHPLKEQDCISQEQDNENDKSDSDDTLQVDNETSESNQQNNIITITSEADMLDTESHQNAIDVIEETPVICEPTAPSLKSGKELFTMIQSIQEGNQSTWIKLSRSEKRLYSQAVSTLKKHYITNYRLYLESLPDKELFDHYIRTFD